MTARMGPKRLLFLAPLLLLALPLQACAAKDKTATSATVTAAADQGKAPQAPTPTQADPADCLVGTWKLDNASFAAFMAKLGAAAKDVPAGIDTSIKVAGDNFLRFDGKGSYRSWTEDFTMTIGKGTMAVQHIENSANTGDYGVVADRVWVAETVPLHRRSEMKVGGKVSVVDETSRAGGSAKVDLFGYRGELAGIAPEATEGSAIFNCDGNALVLESDAKVTNRFDRVKAS